MTFVYSGAYFNVNCCFCSSFGEIAYTNYLKSIFILQGACPLKKDNSGWYFWVMELALTSVFVIFVDMLVFFTEL